MNKEYECNNKRGNNHTMYFEKDRTNSEFSILCKDDGSYDFVDERGNWPTCLQDIQCFDTPPPIPTNEEYVNKKVRNSNYLVIAPKRDCLAIL